jgi:hypothetical protein
MNKRIALRPSVVCLGFGGCVGFVYLFVCCVIWSVDYRAWHKTGSGTSLQEWLIAFSDWIVSFPSRSSLINSLVWLAAGGGFYALLLWRRRNEP